MIYAEKNIIQFLKAVQHANIAVQRASKIAKDASVFANNVSPENKVLAEEAANNAQTAADNCKTAVHQLVAANRKLASFVLTCSFTTTVRARYMMCVSSNAIDSANTNSHIAHLAANNAYSVAGILPCHVCHEHQSNSYRTYCSSCCPQEIM